ncbi:MAG: sigma-70 family RNA polymerase sigma factor [Acidobacteria bacterium]|nr:sigma-70 family RNA polymerase sigma factor [Acidobacteriota bacterium]
MTDAATFYAEHSRLLLSIAVGKFGVPLEDAEAILHDVFLSFLRRKVTARDPRGWLIGAICHASREYHRKQARHARLASVPLREIEEPSDAPIAIAQLLAALRPRDRRILRQRYLEGRSFREIAAAESVTEKRAERLVKHALVRARRVATTGKPPQTPRRGK